MKWCRIIEAEGEQYLCVAAPTSEGLGIVTTWQAGGHMRSAVLPAEEFTGPADALEFLHALRPENVLSLRMSTELQDEQDIESAVATEAAIARAKGLLN